jgi:hypothetical protein
MPRTVADVLDDATNVDLPPLRIRVAVSAGRARRAAIGAASLWDTWPFRASSVARRYARSNGGGA